MNPITEAEVRALFPTMPSEVFDLWLAPAFAESGWPYFAETTILQSPSWRAYLMERPPSFWAGVTWSLRHVTLDSIVWEERSAQKTTQLAEHWAEYKRTRDWRLIPSSPERLQSICDHLQVHKVLPGRLVCFSNNYRWHVLDGYHRLAAALASSPTNETTMHVWLGENAA